MTSVTIDLPDEQAAAFKRRAAEGWLSRQLTASSQWPASLQHSPREAAARIRKLQNDVKPDPEDWTVKDYINFGRR